MAEGHIELESGSWRWWVDDLAVAAAAHPTGFGLEDEADVDGETNGDGVEEQSQAILVLEDPEDPEHWMTRELPDDERNPSEDELREFARDPDLRQVRDDDGTLWRVERIEKPEPVLEGVSFERSTTKVLASSEGGPERVISLPDGDRLGTLPRERLLRTLHA